MKLLESGENYLETILLLHQKQPVVRSVDLAEELNYSKPSISRAVSILKSAGLILIEEGGNLVLTPEGKEKAGAVYERHQTITRYLCLTLGLKPEDAEQDACRIEHIISENTFSRMKEFVQNHN